MLKVVPEVAKHPICEETRGWGALWIRRRPFDRVLEQKPTRFSQSKMTCATILLAIVQDVLSEEAVNDILHDLRIFGKPVELTLEVGEEFVGSLPHGWHTVGMGTGVTIQRHAGLKAGFCRQRKADILGRDLS